MTDTRCDLRLTQDYLGGLLGGDIGEADMAGTFYISKPQRDKHGKLWNWEPVYAGAFPIDGQPDPDGTNAWLDIFALLAPDADPTRYEDALPITSLKRLASLLRQVRTQDRYLRIRHEDTKGRSH